MKSVFKRKLGCVLGLPFDMVTLDEAVSQLQYCCLNRERCFLSTPNLNFAIAARRDNEFYESVVSSDLIVADGMPLVWIARILGMPVPERVAGSTLFEMMSLKRLEGKRKIRVYFFGGMPGVAERAYNNVNASSNGFEACGWFDPGFGSVEEMSASSILQNIENADPDFLIVSLGAKKGQSWIMKNKDKLKVPVISHLGAVVNFVAGELNRAPIWVQRSGLEWVWRIKEEPTLLKRYMNDGFSLLNVFFKNIVPLLILNFVCNLKSIKKFQIKDKNDSNTKFVEIEGDLAGYDLSLLLPIFALDDDFRGVSVSLTRSRKAHPGIVAALLILKQCIVGQGKAFRFKAESGMIAKMVKLMGVEDRF